MCNLLLVTTLRLPRTHVAHKPAFSSLHSQALPGGQVQIPLLNWRSTAIEKLNLQLLSPVWHGSGLGVVDEGWHGGCTTLLSALAFVPGG